MSPHALRTRLTHASTAAWSRLTDAPARSATTLVVLAALLVSAVAPAAASGPTQSADLVAPDEPSLVVALHEDGSANVTLTLTYDLTTDNESDAFQALKSDEEAQADVRQRFLERMRAVAAEAENATGREMRVHDATISLTTSDDGKTGIVQISVVYEGLAATTDQGLVVTEPFASGYVTERAFVVQAPDGYTIASATPSPAESTATAARWKPNTDLSGFELTVQPAKQTTTTTTTTTTEAPSPGLGPIVAVLAVVGAALLAHRRT